MIRHMAIIRWNPNVTSAAIQEFQTALANHVTASGTVLAVTHGPNQRVGPGRYDYAVVLDFESMEAWRAFDGHPLHDIARGALLSNAKSVVGAQIVVATPDDKAESM